MIVCPDQRRRSRRQSRVWRRIGGRPGSTAGEWIQWLPSQYPYG